MNEEENKANTDENSANQTQPSAPEVQQTTSSDSTEIPVTTSNNEPVSVEKPVDTAEALSPSEETTNEAELVTPVQVTEQSTTSTEESNTVETTVNVTQADEHSSAALPANDKSGKKKKLVISVLIVLAALGIAAAIWFLFLKKDSTDQNANTAVVTVDIPVVRVAGTNGPIGTDYLFPKAPGANLSMEINFQAFEGLVGYSDQKIVPLLASSWTNPDNNTWVFTLKDGVKFQNGKAVTAADVDKSLDALVKDENWGYYLQTIKDVSVTGPNQVTIKTSAPDSLLLNRLTYGFIYSQNEDKTVSGTGAYTIDAANSNSETKTKLVAFDGYHQGKPKTKAVEYTVYESDEAIIKAQEEGKVDVSTLNQEPKSTVLTQKGIKLYPYANAGAYGLTLNMVKPNGPLSKKEVREALALAANREAMITTAKVEKQPTNYMMPKTVVGYDETAKVPDMNTAKVKELMTKAGYPNGVPLTFNYIKGLQTEPPVLIEQLNKAGFKVTGVGYPSPKEFVAANRAGNYDLFAGSFTSDLGDGLDIFVGLLDSNASQFPSYSSKSYDQMLRDAEKAFKPEEHVAKVQEINRYTTKELLWIPLANTVQTIVYPSSYDYKVDALVGLNGAYYWKVGAIQTSNN